MKVSNVLLDKETNEIQIFFEHTDYCVRAPLTWHNIKLYEEFNNIEKFSWIAVEEYPRLPTQSVVFKLIAL